jgi:RNA polymerase sigma-70 factor (ECF subfamily)
VDPAVERQLIARTQTGDTEAFDSLMTLYERQVYSLAFRLSGSYDDANDIASEAFIRVFNALPRFRGDAAFSTWLYRIVTNVYLDFRKRKQARQHYSLEEEYASDNPPLERQIVDERPGPPAEAEKEEVARILTHAIQQLPEFQREIITMFHVWDMSYEEIAEQKNLPVGTVKSRLNRARLALREILKPHLSTILDGNT